MDSKPEQNPGTEPVHVVDAKSHLVYNLIEQAHAAAAVKREMVIINCHVLSTADIVNISVAGQGWVSCQMEPRGPGGPK